MSGALYLRRFDVESGGDEIKISDEAQFADAVIELGRLEARQGMVATDMDNTMFKDNPERHVIGDLGVLVFLEKLSDPSFWHFSPDAFKRLLLPSAYRRFAEQNTNGSQEGAWLQVDKSACQKILKLVDQIVQLYAILKRLQSNPENHPLGFNHPVVNEFALKMVHFDDLVKEIEGPMVKAGLAPLLMRVRFLAGSDKAKATALTTNVMHRNADDPDAKIILTPQEGLENIAKDIGLPYAPEEVSSPEKEFLRIVEVNDGIRRLIARLSNEMEIPVHVVTANLHEIGLAAARNSVYRDIIKSVYGSRLEKKENRVGAKFKDNRAINAAAKVDAIKNIQTRSNGKPNGDHSRLVAAFGDSPSGDWPMMEHLLKQSPDSGIVVITGQNVEDILRRFSGSVKATMSQGVKNVPERTWVMTYS